MRLCVFETEKEAANAAAAEIVRVVRNKPDAVLGLATGGTMEPVYEALVAAHGDGLSFSRVTTFNLDEYVGLPPTHPQSYRHYMSKLFFSRVDIDPANTHVPRGDTAPDRAAAEYEATLARFDPIDVQLLGLGGNGHIGFNEPGSPVTSRTRCVNLASSTIEANRRFFDANEQVPETAITMGIATIMRARRLVLLAVGERKSSAVKAMIEGPVDEAVPASILRDHPDARALLDTAAAAKLNHPEHTA